MNRLGGPLLAFVPLADIAFMQPHWPAPNTFDALLLYADPFRIDWSRCPIFITKRFDLQCLLDFNFRAHIYHEASEDRWLAMEIGDHKKLGHAWRTSNMTTQPRGCDSSPAAGKIDIRGPKNRTVQDRSVISISNLETNESERSPHAHNSVPIVDYTFNRKVRRNLLPVYLALYYFVSPVVAILAHQKQMVGNRMAFQPFLGQPSDLLLTAGHQDDRRFTRRSRQGANDRHHRMIG